MTDHTRYLTDLCDGVLIDSLPPSLKATLDRLLAAGEHRADILARVRRTAKGRPLTVAAVEAYLESRRAV
jgi:hypothetical protein